MLPSPILAPVSQFEANVPLVVPKYILDKIVQEQIPQVLFEQKALDMGNGIEGDLNFSRSGEAAWKSIDGQKLQLTLPIRIKGQLGLKKGGLGSFIKSKVPVDKFFNPILIFDPTINSDWELEIREFELLDLGGKIELSVLGFEIDLSGIVQREIRNLATRSFGAGRALLDLKPLASAQWKKIAKPMILDLGSEKTGFSLHPKTVRLHEFFDSNQNLNIWLGLDGQVKSQSEDVFPSISEIPAVISPNSRSQNILNLTLPLTVSYNQLDQLLAENIEGKTVKMDKKTTIKGTDIQTSAFGELLAVKMNFVAKQGSKKPLIGTIFAVGGPFYDPITQRIQLADVNFKISSTNFGAKTGIGLKKRKIIRQIERKAVVPLGNLLSESRNRIEGRLKLSTPYADLKISGLNLAPDMLYPTASGLVIQIQIGSQLEVDWK